MAIPVVIDTDPGVDDALALLLAAASPELEVVAVTTVAGNVDVERATENARRIVTLAWDGLTAPPIHRGCTGGFETAEEVHGVDGLGGAGLLRDAEGNPLYPAGAQAADSGAVEAILAAAEAHPGELTLITLGPLTNVAHAIRENASAMRRVREIVIMGGVFREAGNTGPVAEFNIYVDPESAQAVCDSGLPQRWIPLDVTHRCLLRDTDLGRLPATPPARFIGDALAWYMDYHRQGFGQRAAFLHDPVAVGAVLWPDLFTVRPLRVDVEAVGRHTRGMTVADFRPQAHQGERKAANAGVALEVEAETFVLRFLQRLGAPQEPGGSKR